ncbi:decaprenyl-phosphate phosphoribosyltransferase [Acididesulfobacillus acetoxydans]|nr:decaprenyl-phosphate phosphoribosyltransferase [Acididesulfobacillus acetoxydans]
MEHESCSRLLKIKALSTKRLMLKNPCRYNYRRDFRILNDWFDRHKDRLHPKKRNRPLAAGLVSPWLAIVLTTVLCFAGLTMGYFISLSALLLLILYFVQNIAYSKYLKNVVILDVFLLASGFMLRILAGTLGVGIEPSHWLLLCGLMLTLFIGFGKRKAELKELADRASSHRAVLESYSESLLEQMMGITAGGVIITYSLYTVNFATVKLHGTDALIYTVPLVIYGVFRFLYIIKNSSEGCDPTKLILKDWHLVTVCILWLLSVIFILEPSLFQS